MIYYIGFNPSQVQFTLEEIFEKIPSQTRFQSLTGSIHTYLTNPHDCLAYIVSIPHRFNSHMSSCSTTHFSTQRFNPSQVQFTPVSCVVECVDDKNRFNPSQVQFTPDYQKIVLQKFYWFQSLTGSIHTSGSRQNFKGLLKFQSLTGSIHTYEIEQVKIYLKSFQSLTGSIHTLVSAILMHSRNLCFNPSQVQFTQNLLRKMIFKAKKFQSLTGSIHTIFKNKKG